MRAGLLREKISFQKKERVQSSSGAYSFSYRTLLTTKCHKLREQVSSNEVNAKEEFYEKSVRIQCRAYPLIKEATDVVFQDSRYRILLTEYKIRDNTYIVHLKVNNE